MRHIHWEKPPPTGRRVVLVNKEVDDKMDVDKLK